MIISICSIVMFLVERRSIESSRLIFGFSFNSIVFIPFITNYYLKYKNKQNGIIILAGSIILTAVIYLLSIFLLDRYIEIKALLIVMIPTFIWCIISNFLIYFYNTGTLKNKIIYKLSKYSLFVPFYISSILYYNTSFNDDKYYFYLLIIFLILIEYLFLFIFELAINKVGYDIARIDILEVNFSLVYLIFAYFCVKISSFISRPPLISNSPGSIVK